MLASNQIRFRNFCLGVFALIIVGSFLPGPLCRKLPYYEYCFIFAHMFAYGFLSYLLCFFLSFQRRIAGLRFYEFRLYASVFIIILVLGSAVEGLQKVAVERVTDPVDVMLNQIGCLAGMYCFRLAHHFHTQTALKLDRMRNAFSHGLFL